MPTVAGTVTDRGGNVAAWSATYSVSTSAPKKILGWHADVGKRDEKLANLAGGLTGIKAYRVYAGSVASNGQGPEASQVRWCHDNGLIPVVSYKTTNNGFTKQQVIDGALDARLQASATFLNSFGKLTYVAVDHEPYDDWLKDGDQVSMYRATQERVLPFFGSKNNLRVGPILHGWLMDNAAERPRRFDSFVNQTLLDMYDFFGIDTYQTGSAASPGSIGPGERLPKLATLVANTFGKPNLPLLVGEFNAWEASVLDDSMNVMLNTPRLEVLCMWDRTGGVGAELVGARKTVYENYKNNDQRILR